MFIYFLSIVFYSSILVMFRFFKIVNIWKKHMIFLWLNASISPFLFIKPIPNLSCRGSSQNFGNLHVLPVTRRINYKPPSYILNFKIIIIQWDMQIFNNQFTPPFNQTQPPDQLVYQHMINVDQCRWLRMTKYVWT